MGARRGRRRRRRTVRGRRRLTFCLVDYGKRVKDRKVVLAWRCAAPFRC